MPFFKAKNAPASTGSKNWLAKDKLEKQEEGKRSLQMCEKTNDHGKNLTIVDMDHNGLFSEHLF
jgi:hypothetical protein